MYDAPLRRTAILPFFNIYTVAGLCVVFYLGLTIMFRLFDGANTGVEYLYLLMLLQSVPVVVAFTRRHFNYLSFIMIFHFFQLSLPKWFQYKENPSLFEIDPAILQAVLEQTSCTMIMILVYYAARGFVFGTNPERERFQLLTLTRVQVVLLACYVILVPSYIDHLPAWFLSIHFLLLSADIVLLFTSTSPGNEKLIFVTKAAAIVGSFHFFLQSGMMTLMGALVSLWALVACLKKKYGLVLIIFCMVLCMCAVQTVKGNYRAFLIENYQATSLERLGVLWELIYAKYIDDDAPEIEGEEEKPEESIGMNLISGFMRAGDDSLQRVLAATPSKVPFWSGETYMSIPYMFIPRMLWPDKPSRHFWNKYGRVYGVLSEDDFDTSVGVSYLAEAYMNFGFAGMYFLAFVMGILFVAVERTSFYIMSGDYYYFPYIVFLTPLLPPGTDLGSMLNSLWVVLMVMLVGRPILLQVARRDDYS